MASNKMRCNKYAEEISYIMQEIVESDLVFNINVTTKNNTTPKSPEENERNNEQANTKITIGKIITEIILHHVQILLIILVHSFIATSIRICFIDLILFFPFLVIFLRFLLPFNINHFF